MTIGTRLSLAYGLAVPIAGISAVLTLMPVDRFEKICGE